MRSVVVICTRNRPDDLRMSLTAVWRDRPAMPVVVVDASTDLASVEVCKAIATQGYHVQHIVAERPGLTRQRNQAITHCSGEDFEVIHFLDDDTEILPGYFDGIEDRFVNDPDVDGVGGLIDNLRGDSGRFRILKRMFGLWAPTPGIILRSGRNLIAQDCEADRSVSVDWLIGCSMSFRTLVFAEHTFDERLEGRSMGEDFDFGFRVSRTRQLVVEPNAHCLHHQSVVNRQNAEEVAREETSVNYCWVREQRENGMSVGWFWWATLGDVLVHSFLGFIRRDSAHLLRARGLVAGGWMIAKGKAARSYQG